MRTFRLIMLMFTLLSFAACSNDEKDDTVPGDPTSLESMVEKDLSLKDGRKVYADDSQNEYHTVIFDADHLVHVYKVNLDQGKKYRMSISGDVAYDIDFLLMRSEEDTLFRGEYQMELPPRTQIYWTANSTGIYYLKASMQDVNFHTYTCRLIVEEITTISMEYGGLNLQCSGDWFMSPQGKLAVALHETGTFKYARIMHDKINYTFSMMVSRSSGRPDNYIGIDCYASPGIWDGDNIPASGYLFDVIGPASWRLSYWHPQGSVGFEYGTLPENLPLGSSYQYETGVRTIGDSIAFSVNGIELKKMRNEWMLDTGLYIVVDDTKQDTIYFNLSFDE